MRTRHAWWMPWALLLALVANVALASGVSKEHLAIVKGLKNKGLVGEDNRGLLAFVTEKKVAAEVVKAVNADRLKTYQRIAQEQQVGVEQVGRNRAVQLAAEATAGEWLQDADGKWQQKR